MFSGVSQPEVVSLVKKGLPRIEGKTQKQTQYSIKDCAKWYIAHKTKSNENSDALKDAQIRKTNLEADRIELELAEKRKELIEIAKINQIWSHLLIELKTNLLLIPKKMGVVYDSIRDAFDLESTLNETIIETLEGLSRLEILVNREIEDK